MTTEEIIDDWISQTRKQLPQLSRIPSLDEGQRVFSLDWPLVIEAGPEIGEAILWFRELLNADPVDCATRFVAFHFLVGLLEFADEMETEDALRSLVCLPRIQQLSCFGERIVSWEIENLIHVDDADRARELAVDFASRCSLLDIEVLSVQARLLALLQCRLFGDSFITLSDFGDLIRDLPATESVPALLPRLLELTDLKPGLDESMRQHACQIAHHVVNVAAAVARWFGVERSDTLLCRSLGARLFYMGENMPTALEQFAAVTDSIRADLSVRDSRSFVRTRALLLELTGDLPSAEEILRDVRKREGATADGWFPLVGLLLRTGQIDKAESTLKAMEEIMPTEPRLLKAMCDFYVRNRADYATAQRYLRLWSENDPAAAENEYVSLALVFGELSDSPSVIARDLRSHFVRDAAESVRIENLVMLHWPELSRLPKDTQENWIAAMYYFPSGILPKHIANKGMDAFLIFLGKAVEAALRECIFRPFAEAIRTRNECQALVDKQSESGLDRALGSYVRSERFLQLGQMLMILRESKKSRKGGAISKFTVWLGANRNLLASKLGTVDLSCIRDARNNAAHENLGHEDVPKTVFESRSLLSLIADQCRANVDT